MILRALLYPGRSEPLNDDEQPPLAALSAATLNTSEHRSDQKFCEESVEERRYTEKDQNSEKGRVIKQQWR